MKAIRRAGDTREQPYDGNCDRNLLLDGGTVVYVANISNMYAT